MARSPFSIFTRQSRDRATGKAVTRYCVRFFGEDGEVVKTRTLEATTKTQAVLEAKRLLDAGEGTPSADPLVLDFLLEFWKIDSDYAKMKALRGRPLSYHYVEINASVIRKHLSKPLAGVRLHGLTVSRLERIIRDLADAGVKGRTINFIIQAIRVPIADRARKQRCPDPLQYLQRVAEHPRERGTLSLAEVVKIVALEGENPRVKAAVLLGCLCGLRMGEARGLQLTDIDEAAGVLHIVHNLVSEKEGLKGPKCGSRRDVPLPAAVLEILKLCRAVVPEGSTYVLANETTANAPIAKRTVERGFARILESIGIDENARKTRNLCFHGGRHTFVSLQQATGMPAFEVAELVGHKSLEMTRRYTHAAKMIDFAAARVALDDALTAKAAGAE